MEGLLAESNLFSLGRNLLKAQHYFSLVGLVRGFGPLENFLD